jgi:hypothetical protein
MIESRQLVDPLIDRTGGVEQFLEIDFDEPQRTNLPNLPQTFPTHSTTLPTIQHTQLTSIDRSDDLLSSDSSDSSVGPAKKVQSSRSWIWTFFERTLLPSYYFNDKRSGSRLQDSILYCKKCSWTILESKRHGTSGLIRHMKVSHRVFGLPGTTTIGTPSTKQQRSVISMFQNTKMSTKTSTTSEQAVCNWIVETMQPFVVVETRSFQRIFEVANVQFNIKSGDAIRARLYTQLVDCR